MEKDINLHCTDAYMSEAKLPLHCAMFSIRSTRVSTLRSFQSNQDKVGEIKCYLNSTDTWGGYMTPPS